MGRVRSGCAVSCGGYVAELGNVNAHFGFGSWHVVLRVTPRPKYPALSYVTAICCFGIALSSNCLGFLRYGKLGAR